MAKRKSNTWVWVLIVIMVIAAATGGAWVWLKRKVAAASNLDFIIEGLNAAIQMGSGTIPIPGLKLTASVRAQNPNNVALSFTRPYLRAFVGETQIGTGTASAEPVNVPALGNTTVPAELVISSTSLLALPTEIRNLLRSGTRVRVEVWTTIMGGATIKAAEQVVNVPALSGLFGLGYSPTHSTAINLSNELDRYFDLPDYTEELLLNNTDAHTTVQNMRQIARKHAGEVSRMASAIRAKSKGDRLKEIEEVFNLCKNWIRYRMDDDGTEQIRTPARTWADRKKGVDCDCYSILISSLLHNLDIPHVFRIGANNEETGWQHVWVVATVDGTDYAIDPVLPAFDQEADFTYIEDFEA